MTQSPQEGNKKSKASKRLKFNELGEEFIFKPRRPITRKQVEEALPRTEETEKVRQKDTNRTIITSQGDYIAAMKSQIEVAEDEINQLSKAARDLKA